MCVCVCVCVTQYPSWWLAALAKPFSAEGGWSPASVLWPGHETPCRGSHRAHNPPLDLNATMHFPLTTDQRPGEGAGGGMKDRKEKNKQLLIWVRRNIKPLSCSHIDITVLFNQLNRCTFTAIQEIQHGRLNTSHISNCDGHREMYWRRQQCISFLFAAPVLSASVMNAREVG